MSQLTGPGLTRPLDDFSANTAPRRTYGRTPLPVVAAWDRMYRDYIRLELSIGNVARAMKCSQDEAKFRLEHARKRDEEFNRTLPETAAHICGLDWREEFVALPGTHFYPRSQVSQVKGLPVHCYAAKRYANFVKRMADDDLPN